MAPLQQVDRMLHLGERTTARADGRRDRCPWWNKGNKQWAITLEREVKGHQKLMHWTKCKEGISVIIGRKAKGKDNLGEAKVRVSHRNPVLVSFVRSKDTLSRIVPSSRVAEDTQHSPGKLKTYPPSPITVARQAFEQNLLENKHSADSTENSKTKKRRKQRKTKKLKIIQRLIDKKFAVDVNNFTEWRSIQGTDIAL